MVLGGDYTSGIWGNKTPRREIQGLEYKLYMLLGGSFGSFGWRGTLRGD